MKRMFGPTYDLRNSKFGMDDAMAELLHTYLLRGREIFLQAFFEGLNAGRIWIEPKGREEPV